MAKNKKQSSPQLLSPENYIRQKARKLPIYECQINANWEKMGTAQIIISRIHANGNITMAMYMTDLLCLGVKDSLYMFNVPKEEYENMLDTLSETLDMIKTDYVLVHNIIFAANEYAAELGFKPHKDFISITQYMLEEDTDDIELIEIECGRKEKPLFIKTENTSEAEANRVIKQLEKSVGKGNFDVIFGEDGEMDFDEESDDEFAEMDYDEKRELFLEMTENGLDDLTAEKQESLLTLTDSIYLEEICDNDLVDELIERWETEADMDIADDAYTAESLGIPNRIITEKEMDEFDEIDALMGEKPKKALKCLKELRNKWGNIPMVCYKELKLLETEKPEEFESKLMEYAALYPDFSLLKLELYKLSVMKSKEYQEPNLVDFDDIFEDRSSVTNYEMFEFQMIKLLAIIFRNNLNEMDAMYSAVDDLDLSRDYAVYLKTILMMTRINLLKNYLVNS
ncbi:MAG: hypothetical protein LLF95_06765 [Bacteroidales bacterium]|nr:hypothetical protein [Bacteroidales bacterium]